mmetsp:Transcript_8170/g.10491  ORF Transcript_8170/g.10491 Transcript_8170/m.10491 type:complete len:311 (-) Transcript_8170:1044-1976(-)
MIRWILMILIIIIPAVKPLLPLLLLPPHLPSSYRVSLFHEHRIKNDPRRHDTFLMQHVKGSYGVDSKRKRWIVLVDDERDIRRAVGQYLSEECNYKVTACSDVDMAMKVLESQPNVNAGSKEAFPDCIVSDIRMPGKDGIDFLRILRNHPEKQFQAVPCVLLTAKGLTADRIAGYKSGADAYLTKPFDPEELVAMIESCITRREALEKSSNLSANELQAELNEIKSSLLNGGVGVGKGYVKKTESEPLTLTEQQIVELLGEGLLNREIAERMDLSTRTIEGYLTTLYKKAKVSNRTELLRWSIDTGYVEM